MTNLLLIAVINLSSLPAQPSHYDKAYWRSISSGRPLVVLLGADWCPGCRIMKGRILPEVAKVGGLANVEFAYVDVDRQTELAGELYRDNAIPQLIRFRRTNAGWESQHLTGAHSVQEVRAFINSGSVRKPASKKPTPRLSRKDEPLSGKRTK